MICKVLYFFLVVMPDFLHQQYVVLLYTHLQGGRLKGGWSFTKVFGALLFKKSEWEKIQGAFSFQGTNISHLGGRKIIFKKVPLEWDMLVPWRVNDLFGGNQTMQRYDKFKGFPLKSAFS